MANSMVSGADLQFNLLSEEKFNLWMSIGGSAAPEQDFTEFYVSHGSPSTGKLSLTCDFDFAAYDLRLMLIPEWQLTDSLALGLRLGVGGSYYHWEVDERLAAFSSSGSGSISAKWHDHDLTLQGIVGLQATWMLSENIGVFAFCDARVGDKMELELEGEKVGELSSTSVDAGLGITFAF